MEKQKLIYVESKALFSPSSVSNKAIVFIKDTKEIWTHGTYFICSNVWANPITLTLSGDSTGSVSIDGSKGVTLTTNNKYLTGVATISDYNDAAPMLSQKLVYCARIGSGAVNGFPMSNNANAVLAVNTHNADYTHQLGFSSNKGIYHRTRTAGTWETSWREILTSTNYTNYHHTFASLTNKPTTISGYGITDSIPIIKGGRITTDTDLSTLGMTTYGAKLSVFHSFGSSNPSYMYGYSNALMFRSTIDTYAAISIDYESPTVTFIGGRNPETINNNTPNWWFRLLGTKEQTYNLATIQTAINNLGSTYLPLTGGTLTDTLILKAGAFTASNSNSYSGGRYQAVSKPNIRLIGDSTYGLSTIEFTSLKGDTSINKPSDSGFIQFLPYGVSALSSVGSHPTLKTSGESNALVLGVTNDADDIIVLLSPNISGLRHACGATEYYLPHITTSTTTANKPLVSTTTAHVYTLGDEYLPLKGGTMTGKITLWSSNADAANTGGLNANNSNIYGLNSLYFADASETAAEGINFYRSSTTVDSLWGSNGNLFWTPNRTYGNAGTNYYVLTSNNYSTHLNNTYLPLSGGVMTGLILMTRGSSYLTDTGSGYSMLGMINSGTSATGMNSEEGMFINVPFTLATLRTSGNNLWHYNHANSARYLILDANNYTNYTINYANSNINTYGSVGVIANGKLYYNNAISFARFVPHDNSGRFSYELIAELTNYGTGTNTSYITYGISGFMWAYREGNGANSGAYPITAIVNVGPAILLNMLRIPVTTNALIPFVVKYNDKYYIALRKNSSSTAFYFMGIKLNLLTTPIIVNDASLIEEIAGPITETSTAKYYYNSGTPQEYLHVGNYSNYALPLTGGTLTGILRSTQVAGNLGTSPIVCTGNVTSAAGINNTYSHLASNLAASGVLLIFIGKVSSAYNGCSIGYLHRGDGSNTNAITLGLHSANNLLIVQGNGNVGIGNTSPSYKLSVNGDIYSSGYVRGKSGFIKTDSSNSYVLLGGGGHKLLSDLSSAHTHDWSSITSKPSLLGAMANPIFYPYANDSKLGAYISTINNRFYSADLRYTVTTTNLSGDKHLLFDDNYDGRMLMDPRTTATITIEGYNFVYNNGYIMLYFYLDYAYPLKFPKSVIAKATVLSGTEYTLNRVTAIESGDTIAFLIDLVYLTKLEFTIVSQDDAYCGITNIDYFTRRTENTVRDCAVVTKYNANTLYHNLTAPKYIVKNGTSSQFLKADGSLDSSNYYKIGTELPIYRNVHVRDQSTGSGIFGVVNSGSDLVGGSDLTTVYSGTTNLPYLLRTSADNLYHYNANKSSRYLILDANNYSSYALPLSGGTMTGALNFKNNTWNKVGDDAYMGDCDVAGMIGIKGSNADTPGFAMYNTAGTLLGKLYASGSNLYWADKLLATANGSSTLFMLGDGTKQDRKVTHLMVSYNSWTKTTTTGTAWFPIASVADVDNGSALFIVKAYAHSSIIFTVTRGMTNGNINVLGGGGQFNNSYAYIRGVRLVENTVELGLNAAATLVLIVVKGFSPSYDYLFYKSLVESTNTATPIVLYDINTGGNHNFGIISSKFTGDLTGTATSANKLNTNAGGSTTPVYFSNGIPVACTAYSSATVNKANLLACPDKRSNYPALIVTSGGNIGASFSLASTLGISGDGSCYDTLIIRGYVDNSAGNENALLFSKSTSSVYHSLYAFGSTTTWGTLYKFLDSGNYKNYAPSLSGEGATGTWGISISGTANKVANALTLLLNGGTTSGTNKFVYDGSAAYTVNITPEAIGASATNHTHSYLPLSGGTLGNTSATETELRLKSSTATLRLVAYLNTFNYIQSGNADFNGSTPLQITGYNGTVGSDLYLKFTNIYCRSGNYTNIDSGNYSSYALPLSGGTLTGTLISRDIRPSANLSYSLGTSSYYYNYVYANYFKKNGSSDSYVLLGGGGHKAVSDFAPNNVATLSSSGMGNSDLWTLVFEKSYPANYWYAPTTMFYIRSGTAGCGILCFYNYWASGTQLDDYEREVWFFGALKSETGITFGGANRDINDFFRIYIDKANFKYCIYYNRYNDLSLKILELLFFTVPEPGEYLSTGSLRSSFFTNSTTVVDLPTESSTLVRVPIKTTYNHDRTIRTSKSIYASSFYENSDIRLKENVRGIDLSDLTKLVDLVQFNFKDSGTKKYGVIAQLLELVGLQNLVYENNGNKAVDYISLLVLETLRLRNEIKELKEKLDKKELSS